MGAKEELIQGIEKQTKEVCYTFPNQKKIFGKRKFKFVIKPIVATDFFDEKMGKEAMKEMSTGQSESEAARIIAEKFKKKIMSLNEDTLGAMILQRGVVFPKIVNRNDNLKPDEAPYDVLTFDMKAFLAREIQKISPIFQG